MCLPTRAAKITAVFMALPLLFLQITRLHWLQLPQCPLNGKRFAGKRYDRVMGDRSPSFLQPLVQKGIPLLVFDLTYGEGDRFLRTDYQRQLFCTG